MPTCCLKSFALRGIKERFKLANPGEKHECETCGTIYRMPYKPPFVWQATYYGRVIH